MQLVGKIMPFDCCKCSQVELHAFHIMTQLPPQFFCQLKCKYFKTSVETDKTMEWYKQDIPKDKLL